jgi:RNA polymerase sigma-70 factor (ECF subfamily)
VLDDLTLARARKGDRSAQGDFVRCFQRSVFQLLSRLMVAHPEVVEDLVQDSLLKAILALPKFDPAGPATLSTWVLTIATRTGIDALRKHARIRAVPEPEPSEGPEELVRARELERRVKRAMAELPDDQRAVLVLRAYHDLDYPEIASALEIEVATVKSRLSRARAALASALGEEKERRHG